MYEIVKVNRWFHHGAKVTSERTIKTDATLEEVLAIAGKQKADIDEVTEELREYGCTHFKGYSIYEL